jgi:hypothetical protein
MLKKYVQGCVYLKKTFPLSPSTRPGNICRGGIYKNMKERKNKRGICERKRKDEKDTEKLKRFVASKY